MRLRRQWRRILNCQTTRRQARQGMDRAPPCLVPMGRAVLSLATARWCRKGGGAGEEIPHGFERAIPGLRSAWRSKHGSINLPQQRRAHSKATIAANSSKIILVNLRRGGFRDRAGHAHRRQLIICARRPGAHRKSAATPRRRRRGTGGFVPRPGRPDSTAGLVIFRCDGGAGRTPKTLANGAIGLADRSGFAIE